MKEISKRWEEWKRRERKKMKAEKARGERAQNCGEKKVGKEGEWLECRKSE